VPGNVTARVLLPAKGYTNGLALMEGNVVSGTVSNNWLTLTNVGSGLHALWLATTSSPPPALLFSNWQSGWLGPMQQPGPGGETADPEGDGIVNLLEFAMGGDPLSADAANLKLQIAPARRTVCLSLRERKSLDGAGFGQFLKSTNLMSWLPVTPLSGAAIQDLGEIWLREATFPIEDNQSFYRIEYSP